MKVKKSTEKKHFKLCFGDAASQKGNFKTCELTLFFFFGKLSSGRIPKLNTSVYTEELDVEKSKL